MKEFKKEVTRRHFKEGAATTKESEISDLILVNVLS
jgi:hypothetical protein